jgi:hypothetical protein
MKALVYHGPMDVRIDDKPKPKIEHPEDIILKVTQTAICGSDLHLYHGNVKGIEPDQKLSSVACSIARASFRNLQAYRLVLNLSCSRWVFMFFKSSPEISQFAALT